jgi:hypothetical protein
MIINKASEKLIDDEYYNSCPIHMQNVAAKLVFTKTGTYPEIMVRTAFEAPIVWLTVQTGTVCGCYRGKFS